MRIVLCAVCEAKNVEVYEFGTPTWTFEVCRNCCYDVEKELTDALKKLRSQKKK